MNRQYLALKEVGVLGINDQNFTKAITYLQQVHHIRQFQNDKHYQERYRKRRRNHYH